MDHLIVSTRFADWIDRNLLQVDREDIDQILILREALALRKKARDVWEAAGVSSARTIDMFRLNLVITKLVEMEVPGGQPKPPSGTASLTTAPCPTKLLLSAL